MMPRKGPTPKRSEERRRRNKVAGQTRVQVDGAVEAPEPPQGIDALARDWYLSLAESGQSQFYEPSDWQRARVVAKQLSELLTAEKVFPAHVAAVFAAMDSMLDNESARRRARIEITRAVEAPKDDPKVKIMEGYRERMGG